MKSINLDSLPNRPLTANELSEIESVVGEVTSPQNGEDEQISVFTIVHEGVRFVAELKSDGWVADPIHEIEEGDRTLWWDPGANV